MIFTRETFGIRTVLSLLFALGAVSCSSGLDTGFVDCSDPIMGCPCVQGSVAACYDDQAQTDGAAYPRADSGAHTRPCRDQRIRHRHRASGHRCDRVA